MFKESYSERFLKRNVNSRQFVKKGTIKERLSIHRAFNKFLDENNIEIKSVEKAVDAIEKYFRDSTFTWNTIDKVGRELVRYMNETFFKDFSMPPFSKIAAFLLADLKKERAPPISTQKRGFTDNEIKKIFNTMKDITGLVDGVAQKKVPHTTKLGADKFFLSFVLALVGGGRRTGVLSNAKVEHFEFDRELPETGERCIVWNIPKTKAKNPTDRFKVALPSKTLCVEAILKNYIKRYELSDGDFLFFRGKLTNKRKGVSLIGGKGIVAHYLTFLGFDTRFYSTKSFRVTVVNNGELKGYNFLQISAQTGHKSESSFNMYRRNRLTDVIANILPDVEQEIGERSSKVIPFPRLQLA